MNTAINFVVTKLTVCQSVEVRHSLGCHLPEGGAAESAGLGLGRARQAVRPRRGGVAHYQAVDFALQGDILPKNVIL